MSKSITYLVVIFIVSFFLTSCNDEITNQYIQEPGSGNAPDVNVIFSSYSLNTVHSYHMDTTAYPEYNYTIDLNLKLDKPGNRNQINKLIIVNENGFGWEFYGDALESFYADTLGGYAIKNLVYYSNGQYPPSSNSTYYRVKLFSKANKSAEDYELILTPNFISSVSISHSWYTQSIYQLYFDYYTSTLRSGSGEICWLNSQKQLISKSNFTSQDFVNGEYLRLNSVPGDAYYFYFAYKDIRNGVTVSLKSAVMRIEDRYPDNIQILNENIYSMDVVKYVPEIQKILIIDRSYDYLYILDYNTWDLTNKISIANGPQSVTYSNHDGKIYIGCENGRLYSMEVTGTSTNFVRSFDSYYIYGLAAIDKFIVASTSDYYLRVLNLDSNTVTSYYDYNYSSNRNMVFNATNNVLYGSSSNYLSRVKFNPATGIISDPKSVYSSSSDYSDLILYPDGSKIISSSGNVYSCSGTLENDLINSGSLGQSFRSGSFSSDGNGIITLNTGYYSSDPKNITIYSKNNFSVIGYTEDFWVNPMYLTTNGDEIKVISSYSNRIIAEIFSYSALTSGGKMLPKINKEKYYLPGKLSSY